MKIVIDTQICENYGAHAWDGEGECPQYWKFKGGSTYAADITLEEATRRLRGIAEELCKKVTHDDEYWQEYVINWGLYDSLADVDVPEWVGIEELGR